MMFGEQHLVRFGSMTKPAETDSLGDPQDVMDPQQVTYALLSIAEASYLGESSDILHPFRFGMSSLKSVMENNIQSFSAFFPKLYLQAVARM